MSTDSELLRHYVEQKSEPAFTALVQQHMGLVYSVALRRVGGDAHLAEDIAQKVFCDLARKAPSLTGRTSLSGWLFASVHLASAAVVRGEQRRKARETESHLMQTTLASSNPEPDWTRLRPTLDDAIVRLREDEREAVVLRFFEKRSFAEIGSALRVTEEAARKRVDRATEKLRLLLAQRGVTSTAAALGFALTGWSTTALPEGLIGRVAGQAFAATASTGIVASIVPALKTFVPLAAAVAVGVFLVGQASRQHALREEIAHLRVSSAERSALRTANLQLSRSLVAYEELERAQTELPNVRAALTVAQAQAAPSTAVSATITLTASGVIAWNRDFVSLSQFLERLKTLRTENPPNAQVMIVAAEDAKFEALRYVIDEVRKAELSNVTVQTANVSTLSNGWF